MLAYRTPDRAASSWHVAVIEHEPDPGHQEREPDEHRHHGHHERDASWDEEQEANRPDGEEQRQEGGDEWSRKALRGGVGRAARGRGNGAGTVGGHGRFLSLLGPH